MKKAALRLLPVAALAVFAVAGSALLPQSASSNSPIGNKILAHKLAVELGKEQRRGKEMPVSSGIMYTLYDAAGILQQRAARNPGAMRALGGGNHHRHEPGGQRRPVVVLQGVGATLRAHPPRALRVGGEGADGAGQRRAVLRGTATPQPAARPSGSARPWGPTR